MLAGTIRGPWASSTLGSEPMRTVWTTWSGCDGPLASPARTAATVVAGGWAMDASGAPDAAAAVRWLQATIFDRTRTPLTVWFTACWLFATGKDGISALSLKRTLEIGSYQTAWTLLHRLRSVLVRPGRDRLVGRVEVDETYIGGEEPGLAGGRARGKKVLTGIAVEVGNLSNAGLILPTCRLFRLSFMRLISVISWDSSS